MKHVKAAPSSHSNGATGALRGRTAKKRVTFMINEEMDNLLEIYCNSRRRSKNEVAERAIAEYLTEYRKDVQEALKKTEAAIEYLLPASSVGSPQ